MRPTFAAEPSTFVDAWAPSWSASVHAVAWAFAGALRITGCGRLHRAPSQPEWTSAAVGSLWGSHAGHSRNTGLLAPDSPRLRSRDRGHRRDQEAPARIAGIRRGRRQRRDSGHRRDRPAPRRRQAPRGRTAPAGRSAPAPATAPGRHHADFALPLEPERLARSCHARTSSDGGYARATYGENRRTFCCVTGVEVVVIVVAIILGIAILIGAVLFARRLDRDEPGPTIVRRRYSDSPDYWGG